MVTRSFSSDQLLRALAASGAHVNLQARTGTPAANDNALVVVDKHLGTQPVSGTVTANQGTWNRVVQGDVDGVGTGGNLGGEDIVTVGLGGRPLLAAQKALSVLLYGYNGFNDTGSRLLIDGASGGLIISSGGLALGANPVLEQTASTYNPNNVRMGRIDSFTAATAGPSLNSVTGAKTQTLQVVNAGFAAWDLRLEGSNDNANWTQLIQHVTADGSGTTKFGNNQLCLWFRTRAAGVTGAGTLTATWGYSPY